jgi:hypothetical protein
MPVLDNTITSTEQRANAFHGRNMGAITAEKV